MEKYENNDTKEAWIASLAFVFSLALLLPMMNINVGFWRDELTTAWLSRLDVASIALDRAINGHSPLYFIFIKFWTQLVGDAKWALRLPSIILGSLCPILLMVMMKRWFSSRVILLTGVLVACNNLNIFISHTARMYAATAMLEILFFGALVQWISDKSLRYYVLYCFAVLCGCLIHSLFFRLVPVALAIVIIYFFMVDRSVKEQRCSQILLRYSKSTLQILLPFVLSFLAVQYMHSLIHHISPNYDNLRPQYELSEGNVPPPEPLKLPNSPNSDKAPSLPTYSLSATLGNLLTIPFGSGSADTKNLISAGKPTIQQVLAATLCLILIVAALKPQMLHLNKQSTVITYPGQSKWILYSALVWAIVPALVLVLWDVVNGINVMSPRYSNGSTYGVSLLMATGWYTLISRRKKRRIFTSALLLIPLYFAWISMSYISEGQEEIAQYWYNHRSQAERTYLAHAGYWLETFHQNRFSIDSTENLGGTARMDLSPEKIAQRLETFAGDSDSFWILIFPNNTKQYNKAFALLSHRWIISKEYHVSDSSAYYLIKTWATYTPEYTYRVKSKNVIYLE